MEFDSYIRKPFEVEAVEVTTKNIAEVAKLIGKLKYNEGFPYIQVDPSKVPNVDTVTVGYWVTKVGNNFRAYTHKIFFGQFVENTEEIDAWVRFINGRPARSVPLPMKTPATG